jgi:hypothetical protein
MSQGWVFNDPHTKLLKTWKRCAWYVVMWSLCHEHGDIDQASGRFKGIQGCEKHISRAHTVLPRYVDWLASSFSLSNRSTSLDGVSETEFSTILEIELLYIRSAFPLPIPFTFLISQLDNRCMPNTGLCAHHHVHRRREKTQGGVLPHWHLTQRFRQQRELSRGYGRRHRYH